MKGGMGRSMFTEYIVERSTENNEDFAFHVEEQIRIRYFLFH